MSDRFFRNSGLALALVAFVGAPVFAADSTVVVTPTNMQGWTVTDYRGVANGMGTSNTVAAIDGTYKPSGGENGSVHFSTTDNTGKADYTLYTYQSGLKLGDLSALSYDYYRSSSSTTTNWLAPAIRIYYDADGSFLTPADQGYLIFEPVYNELASSSGNQPSPTNTWVHEDVIGAKFWQRQMSPGMDTTNNGSLITQTIAGWETSGSVGNGDLLSANSAIIGINFGVGSGWSGTFDGAVDHVKIGIGANSTTYNFETSAVAAVPEPSTYAMMVLGLGGLSWAARRRRR